MIIFAFPPQSHEVTEILVAAGVIITREHATKVSLDIPDSSKVEELTGTSFRKYKRVTGLNNVVFELDYFREETQGRMMIVVPQESREYPIYPINGIAAQKYLQDLGCVAFNDTIRLPDSMSLDPETGAVTTKGSTVFSLQRLNSGQHLVIVPRQYQDTFHTVLTEHHLNYQQAAKLLDVPENVIVAMLRDEPVGVTEAAEVLDRLSSYSIQHYTLANVRIQVREVAHEPL